MEREVMEAIYHAFQHWMLCACLAGLGMIAALVFLAKVAAPAWDAVRRWWSLPCIQRILVGVCVVGLSYYGATKQGWHVAYDGGIKAGATANVVTNNTVAIYWQRDTSGGVYVPETATVYIDYRPNTETNAEWGLLAQTTVGAWGWSGTVENATNYDYNVWAYYIPPEPVHTNGVWTYKTHFDRRGEYALPLRARVEVNGVAIATPAEKRKDAEKLPYDAEVEYLESTGTQWINSGVMSEYPKIHAGLWYDRYRTAYTRFFGNYSDEQHNCTRLILQSSANDRAWVTPGTKAGGSINVPFAKSEWHNVYLDCTVKSCTIDGELFTTSNVGTRYVGNIFIFADNRGPSANAVIRISFFKIWDENGVLVRDYIPVRVGTTGYLYDSVSGELFGNKGTGNFGYGNDK